MTFKDSWKFCCHKKTEQSTDKNSLKLDFYFKLVSPESLKRTSWYFPSKVSAALGSYKSFISEGSEESTLFLFIHPDTTIDKIRLNIAESEERWRLEDWPLKEGRTRPGYKNGWNRLVGYLINQQLLWKGLPGGPVEQVNDDSLAMLYMEYKIRVVVRWYVTFLDKLIFDW